MKNLLGKFHAESMPVLGLAQQAFPYKKSGTCSMVRICCHNTYNKNMTPVFIVFFLSKYAAYLVFCQENFMKNLSGKFHEKFVRKIS